MAKKRIFDRTTVHRVMNSPVPIHSHWGPQRKDAAVRMITASAATVMTPKHVDPRPHVGGLAVGHHALGGRRRGPPADLGVTAWRPRIPGRCGDRFGLESMVIAPLPCGDASSGSGSPRRDETMPL